ncbi:MAG TPA: thioesterase II family protein [Longimicrobiaceae bacterium]|nr:thioesterase II family protein [Longimicrobiaceae bacterium]
MSTVKQTSSCIDFERPGSRVRLRLFCFPYAGGGAAVFRSWSSTLPPEVQLCPVHLPGRGNRFVEPPVTRLSVLVDLLAGELAPYLDIPFAFFGHSMGALVAFELARRLRDESRVLPEYLLVSGRRAPQCPSDKRPLHALPEGEFQEELRNLNGTPEEILQHPELMELFAPILRADFEICETYSYVEGEPLDLPVSAFGGLADPDVSREHLSGWKEHTRGPFRLRMFPGGHFFLHGARQELVHAVAEDLIRLALR